MLLLLLMLNFRLLLPYFLLFEASMGSAGGTTGRDSSPCPCTLCKKMPRHRKMKISIPFRNILKLLWRSVLTAQQSLPFNAISCKAGMVVWWYGTCRVGRMFAISVSSIPRICPTLVPREKIVPSYIANGRTGADFRTGCRTIPIKGITNGRWESLNQDWWDVFEMASILPVVDAWLKNEWAPLFRWSWAKVSTPFDRDHELTIMSKVQVELFMCRLARKVRLNNLKSYRWVVWSQIPLDFFIALLTPKCSPQTVRQTYILCYCNCCWRAVSNVIPLNFWAHDRDGNEQKEKRLLVMMSKEFTFEMNGMMDLISFIFGSTFT